MFCTIFNKGMLKKKCKQKFVNKMCVRLGPFQAKNGKMTYILTIRGFYVDTNWFVST